MSKPVRLQLSRRKGFRLQEHSRAVNGLEAVNVARPSKWGNPYRVLNCDAEAAVAKFRRLFEKPPSRIRHLVLSIASGHPGFGEGALLDMKLSMHELRGKNLACWCALPSPGEPDHCHAAVLLELANRRASE